MKDSRLAFEQGLVDKNGSSSNLLSESKWSWIPKTQPLINGFSNEPNTRQYQDVGLDGVSNANEREIVDLIKELSLQIIGEDQEAVEQRIRFEQTIINCMEHIGGWSFTRELESRKKRLADLEQLVEVTE